MKTMACTGASTSHNRCEADALNRRGPPLGGPLLFTRGTRGALAEPLTFVVGKAPAFDFKNPLPWRGKIDVLSVAMAVVDHTD